MSALVGGGSVACGLRGIFRADDQCWAELGQDGHSARAEYHAWRMDALVSRRFLHCSVPKANTLSVLDSNPRNSSVLADHLRTSPSIHASRLEADFLPHPIDAVLGRGGFGVVVRATSRFDCREYAIKVVELQSEDGAEEMSEIRCMAAMPSHPNLIRYHTAWLEQGDLHGWFARLKHASEHEDFESATFSGDDESETSCLGVTADAKRSSRLSRSRTSESSSLAATDNASVDNRSLSSADASRSSEQQRPSAPLSKLWPERLVIQMECWAAPSLQEVLANELGVSAAARTPEHVRWLWLDGIAQALAVMHAHGWAHLDVKPANVLVSGDGQGVCAASPRCLLRQLAW